MGQVPALRFMVQYEILTRFEVVSLPQVRIETDREVEESHRHFD